MSRDFWISSGFTDLPNAKYICVKIILPEKCPECQHVLSIRDSGNESMAGMLTISCVHSMFYDQLWKIRVLENTIAKTKDAPCKQCRKPNDIGISKCWWCECQNPTI